MGLGTCATNLWRVALNISRHIADGTSIAGGTSDSLLGNYDIAENLGSLSQATAGASDTAAGSFDVAAILAQGTGDATATGMNFLVCILPGLC